MCKKAKATKRVKQIIKRLQEEAFAIEEIYDYLIERGYEKEIVKKLLNMS